MTTSNLKYKLILKTYLNLNTCAKNNLTLWLLVFLLAFNLNLGVVSAQDKNGLLRLVNVGKLKKQAFNAKINGKYCNFDYSETYPNDKIGINDFSRHHLCQARCASTDLYDTYFGTEDVDNLDSLIKYKNKVAVYPMIQYSYVPESKKRLYIETILSLYPTLDDFTTKKHRRRYKRLGNRLQKKGEEYRLRLLANPKCMLLMVTHYLIYLKQSNTTLLENYDEVLIKLHKYLKGNITDEWLDVILDLLRYSNTSQAKEFLSAKKFSSVFFEYDSIIKFKNSTMESDLYSFEKLQSE